VKADRPLNKPKSFCLRSFEGILEQLGADRPAAPHRAEPNIVETVRRTGRDEALGDAEVSPDAVRAEITVNRAG
jgi:hypothetical protein